MATWRQTTIHTHTLTPTNNLKFPIDLTECFWTGRKPSRTRRESSRQGENLENPRRTLRIYKLRTLPGLELNAAYSLGRQMHVPNTSSLGFFWLRAQGQSKNWDFKVSMYTIRVDNANKLKQTAASRRFPGVKSCSGQKWTLSGVWSIIGDW